MKVIYQTLGVYNKHNFLIIWYTFDFLVIKMYIFIYT